MRWLEKASAKGRSKTRPFLLSEREMSYSSQLDRDVFKLSLKPAHIRAHSYSENAVVASIDLVLMVRIGDMHDCTNANWCESVKAAHHREPRGYAINPRKQKN